MRVARGLGEAMIEAAAPGAGGVHEHTVEDLAPGFVGVEPLVEEVTQEASALRDTGGDGGGDRKLRAGVVARRGDDVAHRSEADADDDGVARAIDQLVDLAALESAGQ